MSKKKRLTLSDPRVLTGISVFLLLLGEMVTDPLAGFVALVLAALIAAVAMRGSKRLRSFVLALLIVIVILGVSRFPEAAHHLGAYKAHRKMNIPDEEKTKIFSTNARKLLKI